MPESSTTTSARFPVDHDVTDRALDLLVYAPVGFALFVRDQLPNFLRLFARRGRSELADAVPSTGPQTEIRRLVADGLALAKDCADDVLTMLGSRVPEPTPRPAPRMPEPDRSEPVTPTATLAEEAPLATAVFAGSEADVDLGIPLVSQLAITDYDQLSASQVLPRLEGLEPAELDAIRRYELAHRARNSVLGKIDQLAG